MDKNKNIYQLASPKNKSYLMLEIDIEPMALNNDALLNIYRVGYHPNDSKDKPFKSIPIPCSILHNENKYQIYRITLESNLGRILVHINEKPIEARLGVNPLGQGGDFIAFPMLGNIGFSIPKDQKATFLEINIRNFRKPSNTLSLEKDAVIKGGQYGAFITHNPSGNSTPMLRTTFQTISKITKVRLYVTARGIYDFYINGERIGNDYFNPGVTQYNKTLMYQTFDGTDYLQLGENAMGNVLAEGWWSGGATYMGEYWNFFGDRQSLLTKLVITYDIGEKEGKQLFKLQSGSYNIHCSHPIK